MPSRPVDWPLDWAAAYNDGRWHQAVGTLGALSATTGSATFTITRSVV